MVSFSKVPTFGSSPAVCIVSLKFDSLIHMQIKLMTPVFSISPACPGLVAYYYDPWDHDTFVSCLWPAAHLDIIITDVLLYCLEWQKMSAANFVVTDCSRRWQVIMAVLKPWWLMFIMAEMDMWAGSTNKLTSHLQN